jgi:hypothetical protein
MAKRRWTAADVGRQQDRHVMTEHRCGIASGTMEVAGQLPASILLAQ